MTITRPITIHAKNDRCTISLTTAGIIIGTIIIQPDEVFEYLDKLKEAFELLAKEGGVKP